MAAGLKGTPEAAAVRNISTFLCIMAVVVLSLCGTAPVHAQQKQDGYVQFLEEVGNLKVKWRKVCEPRLDFRLVAMTEEAADIFRDDLAAFRSLVQRMRPLASFDCPNAESMAFSGYFIDELVFAAAVSQSDGWNGITHIRLPEFDGHRAGTDMVEKRP